MGPTSLVPSLFGSGRRRDGSPAAAKSVRQHPVWGAALRGLSGLCAGGKGQDDARGVGAVLQNGDIGLLEIGLRTAVYIDEFLRIQVDEREARALHLHHKAVARHEGVGNVVEF